MISLVDIAKQIGDRTLFAGVTLTIGVSERIGLVGPNGSGKTTLLEVLAELQEADAGYVSRNRNATIGYLRQEVPKYADRTLIEEMLAGHQELDHLQKRLALIAEEMRGTEDAAALEALAAQHGELEERFAHRGGYDLPATAQRILGGLGFRQTDFARPTAEFSGGWLMRLALGRLLLTCPHLMLLDEPTNYLDLHSVIWLESYLKSYEGSIVIVSHDRALLDNIAQRILEIDACKVTSYTGNYQAYTRARAVREEGLEAARKAQEREIAKTKLFIDRFRYKNTKARQVQDRIRQLEKMEIIEAPSKRKRMSLRFPDPPKSSRIQVELREVWQGYGGPPVYTGIDLKVERGERLVLVGPNGAGKSTLMKLLAGTLEPDRGERVVGRGVELAYFAQHQVEALDYRRTVLEELAAAAPGLLQERLRGLLGRFLFTADDVFKPIRVLSGGEKARVALAKLLVAGPNLLLLDEPTSHLDIPSRDVLEEALLEYDGTLVTISHDRHFIERLSTRVIEAGSGTIRSYLGDYGDYGARKERETAEAAAGLKPARSRPAPDGGDGRRSGHGSDGGADRAGGAAADRGGAGLATDASATGRRTREDRRRKAEIRQARSRRLAPTKRAIAAIESEIEALNQRLAELEREMAEPEFYEANAGFEETFKAYNSAQAVVESKTQRWEDLLAELEALEAEEETP